MSVGEFKFIGTFEDFWEMLSLVLTVGNTVLIPDVWSKTPEHLYFSEVNADLKRILTERGQVYVSRPDFTRFPIGFSEFEDYEAKNLPGKYVTDPGKGGPVLIFNRPKFYDNNGFKLLNSGDMSYSIWNFNPETQEYEKPSEALKSAYKDMRARLKKQVLRKYNGVWAGPDAIRMLEEGTAKLADPLR